jgi:hypothetical protein
MKLISNRISYARKPLKKEEMFSYVLVVLSMDYTKLVATISVMNDHSTSLSNLYSKMVDFEICMDMLQFRFA